jgi:putative redox protein
MTQETKHVTVTWRDHLLFEGGEPNGPTVIIDGTNTAAPGPMLQLLTALAACTGADVVSILEKMKVALKSFRMDAHGVRAETDPRRYLGIHMEYYLSGEGLDESKARRAIDLSLDKYCSVTHSLRLEQPITYELHLG